MVNRPAILPRTTTTLTSSSLKSTKTYPQLWDKAYRKPLYRSESPNELDKKQQKNDRIPKMSKGSRKLLSNYNLLPQKTRLSMSKSNSNIDMMDPYLDEDDNEGYDIVYDSKIDDFNNLNANQINNLL
jgi:hypothetical protein